MFAQHCEYTKKKKNPLSCTSENGKCYVNFMDMNLNAKRKDKEYQFLMVYLHALPFDLETCAKEIQEILFTWLIISQLMLRLLHSTNLKFPWGSRSPFILAFFLKQI